MKRFSIILCALLYFLHAFPQDRFGIALRCSEQANFPGVSNGGSTLGVAGLGVLHVGVLDLSLGIGYSHNRFCHTESKAISALPLQWETIQIVHQLHFLNVPLAVSVRCWQQEKFRLKIFNELEYNRLCCNVEFVKEDRRTKTIERWGNIPREAVNGLTYRLGLTVTYDISEHFILNLSPFFGVKAILNQYEPYPSHPPHEDYRDHSPLLDHRFSSGVILGVELSYAEKS